MAASRGWLFGGVDIVRSSLRFVFWVLPCSRTHRHGPGQTEGLRLVGCLLLHHLLFKGPGESTCGAESVVRGRQAWPELQFTMSAVITSLMGEISRPIAMSHNHHVVSHCTMLSINASTPALAVAAP